MSWDSFAAFYANDKFAPLTMDAIPVIRSQAISSLRNAFDHGRDIRAQCPFHNSDQGVSQTLRINLDPSLRLGLGFFKCHSCGKKGHWNVLAEKVGIDPITGDANPEIANLLMPIDTRRSSYNTPEGLLPWPVAASWKRKNKNGTVTEISPYAFDVLGAKLWRRVEVVEATATSPELTYKELRAWLPVFDRGFPVAHVAALLSKKYPGAKKYKNSFGSWSKKYIAFLDQVKKHFKDRSVIALVEGPADALRLIDNNVPAVPLLGVNSWTEAKSAILASMYESAVVCLDGDSAGQPAQEVVANSLKQVMRTRCIKMPENEDPASLSPAQMNNLVRSILRK